MEKHLLENERLRKWGTYLATKKLKTPVKSIKNDSTIEDRGDYIEEVFPYFGFAVHELIYIFPGEWHSHKNGDVYFKGDHIKNSTSSVLEFFGIGYDIFEHFLIPGLQYPQLFGGRVLKKDATPKQVGQNILAFLKKIEE
jgi:hypothetical protein